MGRPAVLANRTTGQAILRTERSRPRAGGTSAYGGSEIMTAGELAVVVAAVLCCLGFTALIIVLVRVLDTLRSLRTEVTTLRAETGPLLVELRESTRSAGEIVTEARHDLDR